MREKPTIEQLRIRTGLKKSEFLARANISMNTDRRILKLDESVSKEMFYRCLNVINAQLNTNYELEDIEHKK